jgi:hypothetical protein
MVSFAEALQALLHRPDGEKIQVVYVKLKTGKILVFLGAPVSDEDFDQVEDVVLGECVPPAMIGMAAMFGSPTTAQ